MNDEIINFLKARSSAPIDLMEGPGPTDSEIETMIQIASRVPDHGRLAPWRFILYRGDVRHEVGEKLAELAQKIEGPLPEMRLDKERTRFSRAPLVIGVVSIMRENAKIPQWEMLLSGGAAAMNLCLAAQALGFGTNWITNWYSESDEGRAILGLNANERVIGFIHIGMVTKEYPERPRPDWAALYSDYSGPAVR
ncbi:MAG: nitroreductase [Mesorhizobium sp.]